MTGARGAVAAEWRAGDVVDGRYEVVETLGRGGMGVVHRVRHLGWGTDLAVKSPRPEMFRDAAGRERFVTEAETWVSLGLHPHVCTCHYVRTLGGVPRVFAEYVPGGSLRDRIADRRLYAGGPEQATARILDTAIQIAWGLDHAHGRGLVHQDVKPANVLLDEAGTAKITDFGLARAREATVAGSKDGPGATVLVPGSNGMTPAYASPEQFARRSLGRRSDVFSFAVTVLEMLVGEVTWMVSPAAGATLAACLSDGTGMAVPRIPADLADLLTRCLRDHPRHRPRSMAEVADGLTACYEALTRAAYPRARPRAADLRGDELNNQALSLLDLGRTAEAEQGFAEALAADPRHAQAAYHLGLQRWRRGAIGDETVVAQLEAVRADTGDSRRARFLLAQVHMERGDLDAARELLDGVARERPGDREVEAALQALGGGRITHARCTGAQEMAWTADPPPRTRLPLSLGADRKLALSGEADGTVRLWTLLDGRCRLTLTGHEGPVRSVAFSADGTRAISAGEDDTVRLWDLTGGRCAQTFHQARHSAVAMSSDGDVAVYSSYDGALRVVDTRSGRVVRQVKVRSWGSPSALISPDGRWAMSSETGMKAAVRLWDLATGECRHVLPEPIPGSATGGCFSSDSRYAATYGPLDGPIRIWDVATGRCVRVLRDAGPSGPMSLSDGARYLISVQGVHLRFWDVDSGRCVRRFVAHRGGARAVRLSADGRSAVSAGEKDGTARWWRLPLGQHVAAPSLSRPRPHTELSDSDATVDALVAESERALSDGRLTAALDLLTRARTVPGHERAPRVMSAWRALGRRAVRTDLRAAWVSAVLTGHRRGIAAVDVGADRGLAVTGGQDDTVRVWDLGTGTCLHTLTGHRQAVVSVALSADGRRVLSGDRRGAVRLWSTDTGECLRVLADNFSLLDRARWARVKADEYIGVEEPGGPRGGVDVPMEALFGDAHVRFGDGGRLAVVGHGDGRIRFWDLGTGAQVRAIDTVDFGEDGLEARDIGINSLAIGGGGRLVASGHGGPPRRGASVRLWDFDEGHARGVLRPRPADRRVMGPEVTALCLSADGRLALFSDKATMKLYLWDVATGRCVRELAENAGWSLDARFTADGRFAVSAGFRGVRVWEVGSGRCLRVLDDREGKGVRCLASTPDGSFVLAGHEDGSLRVWELDWELAAPPSYSA
ncbi:protein kinase domain-containing protein [Actinomadura rugatobispora]|uniref:Protein kinase n=1 Tax=Actinomadura rugatobispora TaxID=1994 RepID=A0ABW1AA62_9ACTN|nr:hypothetical protein GCM10010200_079130 [Actinomadura rugatobispora]